jgi:hypothetical protein
MMPTDEYGNTYTSEPGYQGSAASPLPAYRAAAQPRKPLDITPKAAAPKAKPRRASVPLPRPRPQSSFAGVDSERPVASSESSFAKRPVASSESTFAKQSRPQRLAGDYPGRTGLTGSLFAGAGHNPPKPTHAHPGGRKAAAKAVPRHIKGRGLISAKAMAAMGEKLAQRAGHAKPGMSPTGKHGAAAARPEKGQHKPPAAKPRKGQLDSAYAESPVE